MKKALTQKGFVLVGLVAALIFVITASGIVYVALKNINDKQGDEQVVQEETVIETPTSVDDQPVTDMQPYVEPYNISGEWAGAYKVTDPELCAGIEGGWSATLTQSETAVSGTYNSNMASGLISGGAIAGKTVSWKVSGNEGDVTFSGSIVSPNAVDGSFVGPICDEEYAPSRTRGVFFGGRSAE